MSSWNGVVWRQRILFYCFAAGMASRCIQRVCQPFPQARTALEANTEQAAVNW